MTMYVNPELLSKLDSGNPVMLSPGTCQELRMVLTEYVQLSIELARLCEALCPAAAADLPHEITCARCGQTP